LTSERIQDLLGRRDFGLAKKAVTLSKTLFATSRLGRRGNFSRIIQEVRWELDIRGHKNVKIFVSGGLDVESILGMREAPVDGFGIGGAISNSPAIDFALDIVMKKEKGVWIPCAKRGKFSGRKTIWRCASCYNDRVTLLGSASPTCDCGGKMEKLTVQLMEKGRILHQTLSPKEIREKVMKQIERIQN